MNTLEHFKLARSRGVPLLAITTPDPSATMDVIVNYYNGKTKVPIFRWDIVTGLVGLNNEALATMGNVLKDTDQTVTVKPDETLNLATRLPETAILFFLSAHRFVADAIVSQGIWNLREPFKNSRRTWVGLAPSLTLPVELQQDVLIIDEPLPNDEQLTTIVTDQFKYAIEAGQKLKMPTAKDLALAVDAIRGLAAFPAEQATAMSLTEAGLHYTDLWERKRQLIEQTQGLTIDRGGETFADIGGMDQAKQFGNAIFHGPRPPRVCVRLDELEKSMAGATGPVGDNTGVSQDFNGVILREMEDNNWTGLLAVGPPGGGKSIFSKALSNTHSCLSMALDTGAAKGGIVGQSEAAIRSIMKVIKSVAGEQAFFVATCNKLDSLPPELRRRFRMGIWFFDLPDARERRNIWDIQLKKFGMAENSGLPKDEGWTGAEIRNCVELAWQLNCTLVQAANFVVPISVSDPEGIERLRRMAHGKFLSANYAGPYQYQASKQATIRRLINLDVAGEA